MVATILVSLMAVAAGCGEEHAMWLRDATVDEVTGVAAGGVAVSEGSGGELAGDAGDVSAAGDPGRSGFGGEVEYTSERSYPYRIRYAVSPLDAHTVLADPGNERVALGGEVQVEFWNLLGDRPAPLLLRTVTGDELRVGLTFEVDGVMHLGEQIGGEYGGHHYLTWTFRDRAVNEIVEIPAGEVLYRFLSPTQSPFSPLSSTGIDEQSARRLVDVLNGEPKWVSVVLERNVFGAANCGAGVLGGGLLVFFFNARGDVQPASSVPPFLCEQ